MEFTLKEIKPIWKDIIENNITLQENGQKPVSVNLCGPAGYGKSAIAEQIAKELDANYILPNKLEWVMLFLLG